MRRSLTITTLIVAVAVAAFADGGGVMMAGSGMMIVAEDNSLLITNMDPSGVMVGGLGSPGTPRSLSRELVNVSADGTERWRASFDSGWPMMPVTESDLVVVVLVDDWFVGWDGSGDGGWTGGMGSGVGGGMGGGTGDGDSESTLVALDLASGQERWRATVPGDMGSMVQFSDDGSRLYVSAREMGSGEHIGPGSMTQGQAAGAGFLMSTTIVAFDREGNQLWSLDLGGE